MLMMIVTTALLLVVVLQDVTCAVVVNAAVDTADTLSEMDLEKRNFHHQHQHRQQRNDADDGEAADSSTLTDSSSNDATINIIPSSSIQQDQWCSMTKNKNCTTVAIPSTSKTTVVETASTVAAAALTPSTLLPPPSQTTTTTTTTSDETSMSSSSSNNNNSSSTVTTTSSSSYSSRISATHDDDDDNMEDEEDIGDEYYSEEEAVADEDYYDEYEYEYGEGYDDDLEYYDDDDEDDNNNDDEEGTTTTTDDDDDDTDTQPSCMWYGHDCSHAFFPDERFWNPYEEEEENNQRFKYRFDHLGVKQLFDPTIMHLHQYYKYLLLSNDHVQKFLVSSSSSSNKLTTTTTTTIPSSSGSSASVGEDDNDDKQQEEQHQHPQQQRQQEEEWSENYESTTEHLAASQCLFRSEMCLMRYALGECWDESSPTNADDYYNMTFECCPICQSIPSMDYLTNLCPRDPNVVNPFESGSGSVTQLFVNMLTKLRNKGITYHVHAMPFRSSSLSNNNDDDDDHNPNIRKLNDIPDHVAPLLVPPPPPSSHTSSVDDETGSSRSSSNDDDNSVFGDVDGGEKIKFGPWIVTIEDFVTQEQVNALIGHGERQGYERSYDGVQNDDGSWERKKVQWRTSGETFCNTRECLEDPIVQQLMRNVTSTVGIPESHCDYLQLLKYTKGQLYGEHSDYDAHQVFASAGARSITWYMYLSDIPNGQGGETQFPRIPIKVAPKLGRVLVWSSIRDDDPIEEDLLGRHEALPIITTGGGGGDDGDDELGGGPIKYGATAWFHSQNIRQVPYRCRD